MVGAVQVTAPTILMQQKRKKRLSLIRVKFSGTFRLFGLCHFFSVNRDFPFAKLENCRTFVVSKEKDKGEDKTSESWLRHAFMRTEKYFLYSVGKFPHFNSNKSSNFVTDLETKMFNNLNSIH